MHFCLLVCLLLLFSLFVVVFVFCLFLESAVVNVDKPLKQSRDYNEGSGGRRKETVSK